MVHACCNSVAIIEAFPLTQTTQVFVALWAAHIINH
jgi:hypothetical protein